MLRAASSMCTRRAAVTCARSASSAASDNSRCSTIPRRHHATASCRYSRPISPSVHMNDLTIGHLPP
eukprot:scaffold5586_cov124-Isochrysis_galbana.AAC.12